MKQTYLTNINSMIDESLVVDLGGLKSYLKCGSVTAKAIAASAGAEIPGMGRRKYYSLPRIKDFLSAPTQDRIFGSSQP